MMSHNPNIVILLYNHDYYLIEGRSHNGLVHLWESEHASWCIRVRPDPSHHAVLLGHGREALLCSGKYVYVMCEDGPYWWIFREEISYMHTTQFRVPLTLQIKISMLLPKSGLYMTNFNFFSGHCTKVVLLKGFALCLNSGP